MDGLLDGWMDGWMDCQMDEGWMDEWMEEWMDGWTNELKGNKWMNEGMKFKQEKALQSSKTEASKLGLHPREIWLVAVNKC